MKILLGFASLGIAGLVYLFSCPAKSCQGNTLISVIFFFVLSILGPWFTQTLEKKAIIVGTIYSQNSCTIRVETKLARYDNSFETVIEVINGIERKRFKWTTPYNQYFTNKGTFLQHNFQVSFQKFYEESKANASS